jgi:hypothetical protein
MSVRGLGDRWLAGEAIDGVAFAQGARVVAADGRAGRILLLMSGPPDPLYLVELDAEPRPRRVRQSALREE